MKKMYLVGGLSYVEGHADSLKDLTEYLETSLTNEYQILATHIDDLVIRIAPGFFDIYDTRSDSWLSTADVLFIRGAGMRSLSDHAFYLSRFAAYHGIKCPNDYSNYYPGTKLSQMILFLENNAPFLETYYAINKDFYTKFPAAQLPLPAILKTNVGSHGDANYVVENESEIQSRISNEPDIDFLLQQFCPNNRDYRLLLVGNEILLIERRGGADTHLNNTSKGAGALKVESSVLPPMIIELARTISEKLQLAISGVDIIPNIETGEYYFLEINTQPQLRTGAFVDEKSELLKSYLS